MDFLVLPSHREGFPNAPMEAAAMAIPCITTDAVGCVDAVEHEATGLIVPVGDARGLAAAFGRYLGDGALCAEHGAAARNRALESFAPIDRHTASLNLYERLLRGRR
jgi:glycosyltransferase involved in cell wall biosynthesis